MGTKKTFTYATDPAIRDKASRKAGREKLTLSEKIDQMLREYVKPIPKKKGGIDLPADYVTIKSIAIQKANGLIEKLK